MRSPVLLEKTNNKIVAKLTSGHDQFNETLGLVRNTCRQHGGSYNPTTKLWELPLAGFDELDAELKPYNPEYGPMLSKWLAEVEALQSTDLSFPEIDGRTYADHQKIGVQWLVRNANALLLDDQGLGKTMQAAVAMRTRFESGAARKFLIVCPRAVVEVWLAELAICFPAAKCFVLEKQRAIPNDTTIVITHYERARRSAEDLNAWEPDMVTLDECFPAGTLVDGKPIETYKVGDTVRSFNHAMGSIETKTVKHLFKTAPSSMVTVHLQNGTRINCTANHPFFTKDGYLPAAKLTCFDSVYVTGSNEVSDAGMSVVRSVVHDEQEPVVAEGERENDRVLLQQTLLIDAQNKQAGCKDTSEGELQGEPRQDTGRSFAAVAEQQPDERSDSQGEGQDKAACQRSQTTGSGRERETNAGATAVVVVGPWLGYGSGSAGWRPTTGPADMLQDRHSEPCAKGGHRSGRYESQGSVTSGAGPEERDSAVWVGVDRVEVHQPTSDGRFGGLCPDGYVYNIEVEDNNNYFVDGVLVHNCHRVKNRQSVTAKAINTLQPKFRLAMTGTLLPNKVEDVWFQVNWAVPGYFPDFWTWLRVYANLGNRFSKYAVSSYKNLDQLKQKISDVSLRRTKDEVLDLPERMFQVRHVPMTSDQRAIYEQIRQDLIREFNDDGELVSPNSLTKFLRLAQAASNPALISEDYPESWAKYDEAVEIIEGTNSQMIVWSCYRYDLMRMQQILETAGITCAIYNGQTPQDERARIIRDFQSGKIRVFLGSPAACREGITLTAADTMIYLNRSFNAVDRLQSQDRNYRIGQANRCMVYDLIVPGTIDELTLKALKAKAAMNLYAQSQTLEQEVTVSAADLRYYLERAAQ